MTSIVGYGRAVYTFRRLAIHIHSVVLVMLTSALISQYWLWCPVIGPIVGAQLGVIVYDTLLFTGEESLINRL
jgi:aquaglyceroporin related protein